MPLVSYSITIRNTSVLSRGHDDGLCIYAIFLSCVFLFPGIFGSIMLQSKNAPLQMTTYFHPVLILRVIFFQADELEAFPTHCSSNKVLLLFELYTHTHTTYIHAKYTCWNICAFIYTRVWAYFFFICPNTHEHNKTDAQTCMLGNHQTHMDIIESIYRHAHGNDQLECMFALFSL